VRELPRQFFNSAFWQATNDKLTYSLNCEVWSNVELNVSIVDHYRDEMEWEIRKLGDEES